MKFLLLVGSNLKILLLLPPGAAAGMNESHQLQVLLEKMKVIKLWKLLLL